MMPEIPEMYPYIHVNVTPIKMYSYIRMETFILTYEKTMERMTLKTTPTQKCYKQLVNLLIETLKATGW